MGKILCNCEGCNEEATNFHSKCCNAHFEGILCKGGELQIVCEECGKYAGTLKNKLDK